MEDNCSSLENIESLKGSGCQIVCQTHRSLLLGLGKNWVLLERASGELLYGRQKEFPVN